MILITILNPFKVSSMAQETFNICPALLSASKPVSVILSCAAAAASAATSASLS